MIRSARLARLAGGLAASLALAGCITLFPKTAPSQLYRFEASVQPSAAPASRRIGVRADALDFDPASRGDRILTVAGDQLAYIQGARWAAPATQLFQETLEKAFDQSGDIELVTPGQASGARYRLQLEVTRFEARYDSGPKAPPTVVVHLRAQLSRESDTSPAMEKDFEAEAVASDNRVGPIVAAYDAATTKTVGDLIAWIEQGGG